MNTQISLKQMAAALQFSHMDNVDEALACSRGQNPSLRNALTTSGWLLGLNGLHIGEDLRLYPGSNVIGSSARCHVVLTAPGVGRQHAIVDVLSGESALLHPGSTRRELFLNDVPCTSPAPLCHGDTVRLGEQSFAYISLLPSRKDEQTTIFFNERFPARGSCTLGWLVELAGDRVGRDFRLVQGENRIGSQRGLEVVLFDPEIQLRHAVITRHSDNWIIVPVTVSEPIYVNGVPSTGIGLQNGDIVRLGQREFLFRSIKVGFTK
ncbi:MAG: FHA domain-containing protein [Betaproteobacteria bacterium]|nr:FHA domain-containing protein [Betaproteobacteria bacterium]